MLLLNVNSGTQNEKGRVTYADNAALFDSIKRYLWFGRNRLRRRSGWSIRVGGSAGSGDRDALLLIRAVFDNDANVSIGAVVFVV